MEKYCQEDFISEEKLEECMTKHYEGLFTQGIEVNQKEVLINGKRYDEGE